MMIRITSREQLNEMTRQFGSLGSHEAAEQDPPIGARVEGTVYAGHGFWPSEVLSGRTDVEVEKHVVFTVAGRPVAAINLAHLVAMAQFSDAQ